MTTNNLTENGGAFMVTGPDVTGIDVGVIGVRATRTRSNAQGTCAQDADRLAWTVMEDYAALVRDRTPIRAGCLPLAWAGADTVAARIAGLPSWVSAVFVVGMGPSESASVQLRVASLKGPVVISELDVVTAALGAAAISSLRCRGVAPRRGAIVVTGVEVLPRLGPLLLASGVGMLTTWNQRDGEDYPLRRVTADNDLLIDLAGAARDAAAPGRTLRLPRERFDYGALVLPGLLSALCGHHGVSLTIDVLAACARALALLTPPDRTVPALTEPLLAPTVAAEVARTLAEHPPPRESRTRNTPPQPATQRQHPGGQPS
jgi:hypothetical protein